MDESVGREEASVALDAAAAKMACAKDVKFTSGLTGAEVASVEAFDVEIVDATGALTAKDEEESVKSPVAWRRLVTADESPMLG